METSKVLLHAPVAHECSWRRQSELLNAVVASGFLWKCEERWQQYT